MSIWPPLIWLLVQFAALGFYCSKGWHNGLSSAIALVLAGSLLWWGNFFAPLWSW